MAFSHTQAPRLALEHPLLSWTHGASGCTAVLHIVLLLHATVWQLCFDAATGAWVLGATSMCCLQQQLLEPHQCVLALCAPAGCTLFMRSSHDPLFPTWPLCDNTCISFCVRDCV